MSDLELNHFDRTGDDADHALVQTENDLKIALYRKQINEHNDTLIFTGFCHFCGCEIDHGKFCPVDRESNYSCAAEYKKRKDAEKRNGFK